MLAREGGRSSLSLSLPKANKLANFFGRNFGLSVENYLSIELKLAGGIGPTVRIGLKI